MRKRKDQAEEVEEIEEAEEDEELDEKTLKKKKREEAAEKRKQARKKDKVARWSGTIMLLLVMAIGFLLWISGQITQLSGGDQQPIPNPAVNIRTPSGFGASPPGKIIVR